MTARLLFVAVTVLAVSCVSLKVEAVIEKWQQGCHHKFPEHPKLCDSLVKSTVNTLPWIHKQLTTLAWEIPEAFCSVFIPACSIECCQTEYEPEQLRLSFTEQGLDTMRVSWSTLLATPTSSVEWWPAAAGPKPPLKVTARGSNHTYTTGGWRGQIHTAVMTNLASNTTYSYRVGDNVTGWSDVQMFRTLPKDVGRGKERPLRIAQVGDMGYGNKSDSTIKELTRLARNGLIDAVLHNGDVGYADGYQRHWDVFLRKIEPISSRVPYLTAPGNHEFWFNFSAYKSRFQMPMYEQYDSMHWSVDVGPLHLVVLNTESVLDTSNLKPEQLQWLARDLAEATNASRRKDVPWIVTSGHRPFYCSDHNKEQCGYFAAWLRLLGEASLTSHHVDLVIQAHEHNMQRSYPLKFSKTTSKSYVNPDAPVYIVSGAAGNREHNSHPGNKTWLAWSSSEIGYSVVEVVGSKDKDITNSLGFSFYRSSDGKVLDHFEIVKT
eukprot:jgi/Bigna1/135272/aug1.28_g9980